MELYQNPTAHKNITRAQVLRAALAYAGKGIPVFPCKPGDKEPLTPHGFKDATTDPSKITAWLNRWPDANIGIPTGKRSGLLVLDVDHPAGVEVLEVEHGELTATRTHSTGSGGMHYLYRYPKGEHFGNSSGDLPDGYDIRGEGGYIIAPPSSTTRPYEVLDRLPLVDAPEWLLEALRRPHRAAGEAENPRSPAPIGVGPGEPIREGQRNWSLYRYASALRGRGFDQAAILDELEKTNGKLCKPPLYAGEVEKIASSAAKHEPGNASPGASAEVLEALEGIEEVNLWGRSWKGQGFKTPRSVMVVLIEEARRHGQKTKAGVRVSISVRALALAASVSKRAVIAAIRKLKKAELIRAVKGSGTKSGAYVLVAVAGCNHSTTEPPSPSSGNTYRRPQSPRLRYSKPVYEAVAGVSFRVGTVLRLGKRAENVIDILERAGELMSVPEIGATLGIKNHRDLTYGTLPRLEDAGVVECSADGVCLRPDWLAALNLKREEDQEIADYERDKAKYAEESRVYALKLEALKLHRVGMEIGEIAAELRVGTEDVYRLLDIARPLTQPYEAPPAHDGYTSELERVPDQQEDHVDHIESFDFADEDQAEDFDGIEAKPLSPLAVAIRRYLDDHPDDSEQSAYWLGATCWAFDLYPTSPTQPESRDALRELGLVPARHLEAVA